ncbi:MAG: zinc ribbon domain-containing protein [Candidatus Thermoplasmatota archaeon]|nr:zinc ribbon domain-containing protein [Candidatus Thermoplasmatota archaeon]
MTNTIKERNVILVYLLGIFTLGIYFIYWYIQTKREINENFGASIPTCWLLILPIANIYFIYKYAEAYSLYVLRDDNKVLWAILFIFVGIIVPALVQIELNKYVGKPIPSGPVNAMRSNRRCPNCDRIIPEDATLCPYCGKNFQVYS